jgi:4-amino-4-deoxy-L-arabinose transferase-like glycosyltransferase
MTDTRSRQWAWVIVLGSVAIALLYAFIVPAGQPYDEPAHWSNVRFYEQHHRMPELGERGASYEAQMGPVYYSGAAIVARAADGVFDRETAFYVVRVLGALLVGAAAALTLALGRVLFPCRRGAVLVAAAFIGLNPSLVAVSTSIQNDALTMVLALGAALLAVRILLDPMASLARWFVVGLVTGLATLTKIFAAGLLVGLGVAAVASAKERSRRMAGWGVATAGLVLVSGWWFVRNQVVYGDLSGRTGVDSTGLSFPPAYHGLGDVGSWVRSMLSYLWIPTEYYRNAFSAPFPLRAVVVLLTVFAIGAGAWGLVRAWRARPEGALSARWVAALFLASWFALTFAVYTAITWQWTNLAARIMFVALPGVVVLVCGAVDVAIDSTRVKVTAATMTVVVLVASSVFVLYEVAQIGHMPFTISFTR